MAGSNGTKDLQEGIAIQKVAVDPSTFTEQSVIDFPDVREQARPLHPLLLQFAMYADEITPWGVNVPRRDQQLREFWISESMLSSAVYSVSVRNASFDWEIINTDESLPPHKNTIRAARRMLQYADRGAGFDELIKKTSIDLYCADNGSFWELVRLDDSPTSPVINIAHLDSGRCVRTGDPQVPIEYTDRLGRRHLMKWYQIVSIEEFPSPIETMYGVQYCAVTRALLAAQILRNIAIYKLEKVAGRWAGALHLISGISRTELEDMVKLHYDRLNNQGQMRYSPPIMVPGIDPGVGVDHRQIDLASLPENFDEDTSLRWYVTQLALAFGVDYQEFAPLPAGNIGSSGQSEIMHLKTRGKGPAVIMKLIEHIMNTQGILPNTVKFRYKVQDLRADGEAAKASFDRAKDRAQRISSGELDVLAARKLAVRQGDLPQDIFDEMMDRPIPEPQTVGGITGGQAASGSESQFVKASDINRIETLTALRRTGKINFDTTLPEIDEEDINRARQRAQ